jgi:hypothetical protein
MRAASRDPQRDAETRAGPTALHRKERRRRPSRKGAPMAVEPETLDQLSQVISHSIAPAFILGAMSAYISMLSSRIDMVLGRIRGLNAISADDKDRIPLKQDIQRLTRRLRLLRRALLLSVAAGFVTTLLMVSAFALAIFGIQHVWIVAILFIVALSLFSAAILTVGLDGAISVSRWDHF